MRIAPLSQLANRQPHSFCSRQVSLLLQTRAKHSGHRRIAPSTTTMTTNPPEPDYTNWSNPDLISHIRLTAGFLVLLALLLEYNSLSTETSYCLPPSISAILPSLPLAATSLSTSIRACAYAATCYLVLRKGYTSESLLVIRGLGVQTATAGSSFLWGGSTRFIAASAVQDVFIHEAFRGFEVRFYLCIVVEGEEGVVVVFPVSLFHIPSNGSPFVW